jgi:hypothetical protein
MRTAIVLVWLVVPLLVGAYHYGPGQQRMQWDDAAHFAATGDGQAQAGDHANAVRSYDAALAALPADATRARQRIRLERAKSQLLSQKLPEAHEDLTALVDELETEKLEAEESVDAELLSDARCALANTQYYMTWLMRLEGLPKDVWEPEIESARQTYRLIAERAEASDDAEAAQRGREDLESAIRLARMDLSDLQALPLASQCQGCKSCQGCCNGKKKGKKKSKSDKPPEDNRGASSGLPPDNSGS